MIPKIYEIEILLEKEIVKGDRVKILDEFVSPTKFKGFLQGTIDFKGVKKYLIINKSSYRQIANVYGENTKEWLGKGIEYEGRKKMGAMEGRSWIAVT